jgi:hypothetical protein
MQRFFSSMLQEAEYKAELHPRDQYDRPLLIVRHLGGCLQPFSGEALALYCA